MRYFLQDKGLGRGSAQLGVQEVVALTLDYQRRGLIDGLFLSSGVKGSADETMEAVVAYLDRVNVGFAAGSDMPVNEGGGG